MDFEEDTYSSIFLAVKHPVRRKILSMLNEAPATYTQILSNLKVETGFLNYHLESLNGLITKNEHDKYLLSDFGEAALTLTKRVEEPIKRKSAGFRVFGLKINPVYILLVIMVVSIISNAYWINTSQGLFKDKMNAFGEVVIQTKGFLGESINILNTTVSKSKIEFEIWDVMLRDLIQLSWQYNLIISLDTDHRQQWSQIKTATDSLIDFTSDVIQTYARNNTYIDITNERSTYLNKVENYLLNIQQKAFPSKVIIGSNPQVNIIDREITEAMETAIQLQVDLKFARKAFNLPAD